jgi:hypothetical protein
MIFSESTLLTGDWWANSYSSPPWGYGLRLNRIFVTDRSAG